MSFLEIPGEVITHHLLPVLSLGELLRLRRVCKFTKDLAQDYIRLHVRSTTRFSVGSKDGYEFDGDIDDDINCRHKCVGIASLLSSEVHLPTTHFHLSFPFRTGEFQWDEDWDMGTFLGKYGEQITHLEVRQVIAPMTSEKQNEFYERLPNLRHLVIDVLDLRKVESSGGGISSSSFPSTFRHLTSVSVKHYFVGGVDRMEAYKYIGKLVFTCENLEHFGYPAINAAKNNSKSFDSDSEFDSSDEEDDIMPFSVYTFGYLCVLFHIRRARAEVEGGHRNLKSIDLGMMDEEDLYTLATRPAFVALCTQLADHDVKLMNVKAEIFSDFEPDDDDSDEEDDETHKAVGKVVASLQGMRIEWLRSGLSSLEKLSIDTGMCALRGVGPEGIRTWKEFGVPAWPSLEILELLINSDELVDGQKTEVLFRVLFSVPRPGVTELKLRFQAGYEEADDNLRGIPVPPVKDIVTSCFNLRKLTLTRWNGTNKAASNLWEGLPLLEEVSVERCTTMGNVAFVGKNTRKPSFLQLKNLKKLSLKFLDKMPKITDTVFELVFRHIKLRELVITCSDEKACLKSVTATGIKFLLSGEFAKTIERFAFERWALEGVGEEEFTQLRNQFRSSQWH